jgi:hypothetical protein
MVRADHGVGVINYLAAVMIRRKGLEIRHISQLNVYRDVGIWWHSERPLIDLVLETPRPAGTSRIPMT